MAVRKNFRQIILLLLALGLAVVGSHLFVAVGDSILNRGKAGGFLLSDASTSSDSLLFGFYLGLFFCISFVHFAFIRRPARYFYIIIGVLLATSLILIDLFLMALGFAAAGAASGYLTSILITKQKKA